MSINPVSFIDLSIGQQQAFTKSLTKLNTDVLFTHIALGEGPVYRINPNGVQDIRISNKFIDDLIDETGAADPFVFQYKSSTGTMSQQPLQPFGNEIVNNFRFSGPINLKSGQSKGELTEVPASNIQFYPTSTSVGGNIIDTIVFKFSVDELSRNIVDNTSSNSIQDQRLDLRIIIHPRDETSNLDNYVALVQKSFTDTITFSTTLEIPVTIPTSALSDQGYRVSVIKGSDDSVETEISSEVSLLGFDELSHESFSYPRTATIGYALKATNFRSDIPDYTSLVKGLIVKVPSNYDQPILDDGQVDWRELEVDSPQTTGYKLQSNPNTIIYEQNPVIYKGIWDGKFKYDWTQNPVWIIYDLLTNTTYGFGISESLIDKYNFYKISQICDSVDPTNGRFIGVDALADGSFRHKPRGQFTSLLDNQLGLSSSTLIKERRFKCDLYIADTIEGIDLINRLAASFRGILDTSGNKIRLIVDYADALPDILFNEVHMTEITFSGVRRDDYVSAVEVTFMDATNNYKREVVRVSDPSLEYLPEKSISVEVFGCSSRSQAMRYAQYLLATKKYIKRKIELSTFISCDDLTVGSIVSVSTQTTGSIYGYNGIIQQNSISSNSFIYLQHLSYPSISNTTVFEANTNPLVLRHFSLDSEREELYLLSNTNYYLAQTGNTESLYDYVEVSAVGKWNALTRTFESFTSFPEFNTPKTGDLWALGEIDPGNYYNTNAGKLFRVDSISIRDDGLSVITGTEYVSNVYVDSDTFISYQPTPIKTIANPFVRPDPPQYDISLQLILSPSGGLIPQLNFNFSSLPGNLILSGAFIPQENFVPILGIV